MTGGDALSGCSATPATASSRSHRSSCRPRPSGRRWSPGWRRCGRTPPPTTAGPRWPGRKADRGWELPRHLAVGDVLEFGLAAVNAADGTTVEGFELRWYGWLAYSTDLALVVEGPYPHAPAAADGAAATVASLRLAQLPNVGIDPGWVPDELGDDLESER